MGIAAVVGGLLLVVIVNSAGLYSKQSAKVQGGLNINDALSEIRGSIKQASSIADTSSASQLVLKVASIDSLGEVIADTYDLFVFFLDQNYLRFQITPDPASSRKTTDRVFSNSVNNLNFQYFNSANPPLEVVPTSATKVRISLNLEQKFGDDSEINVATSEADLRND